MIPIYNFLIKRRLTKCAQHFLTERPTIRNRIVRLVTCIFTGSHGAQVVSFPYMPKNIRKNAMQTLTTVRMLQVSTNALQQLGLKKRELKELAILSRSSILSNGDFQNKSTISQNQKEKILTSKKPSKVIQRYIMRINKETYPFRFHALFSELEGFYSASVDSHLQMRMIFTVGQDRKPEFFTILPSHNYALLTDVVNLANDSTEVKRILEAFNVFWFNQQLSPEDQYRYFVKKCIREKCNKDITAYLNSISWRGKQEEKLTPESSLSSPRADH